MKTIKIIGSDWEMVASKSREANEERCQDRGIDWRNICGCCGKEIKEGSEKKSLRLIEGGEYFTEYDGELDGTHDMGWWNVGPVCYKKFLKNRKEIETRVEC